MEEKKDEEEKRALCNLSNSLYNFLGKRARAHVSVIPRMVAARSQILDNLSFFLLFIMQL